MKKTRRALINKAGTFLVITISLLLATKPISGLTETEVSTPPPEVIRPMNEFLDTIGHRESSNNYLAVNTYGYMGKYQFGKSTLRMIGIHVDDSIFLSSPSIQEKAMIRLLKFNKKILNSNNIIKDYKDHTIGDVVITESGLLAASHLLGAGSVIKYFNERLTPKDGNGVCITDYMTQFSGYSIDLDD